MKTRRKLKKECMTRKPVMSEGAKVSVDEFANMYGDEVADALEKFCDALHKNPEDVINGSDSDMTRFENWAKRKLGVDIYKNFGGYDYSSDLDKTARGERDEPIIHRRGERRVRNRGLMRRAGVRESRDTERTVSLDKILSIIEDFGGEMYDAGTEGHSNPALRERKIRQVKQKIKRELEDNPLGDKPKLVDENCCMCDWDVSNWITQEFSNCNWVTNMRDASRGTSPTICITTSNGDSFYITVKPAG